MTMTDGSGFHKGVVVILSFAALGLVGCNSFSGSSGENRSSESSATQDMRDILPTTFRQDVANRLAESSPPDPLDPRWAEPDVLAKEAIQRIFTIQPAKDNSFSVHFDNWGYDTRPDLH